MKLNIIILFFIISSSVICGCAGGNHRDASAKISSPVYYAVAVLNPIKGHKVSGHVSFSEAFGRLKIEAEVSGLDFNSTHGFHIHEFGDCTASVGDGTGGHYNPENHRHGGPNSEDNHAGDLGNLTTDKKGNAKLSIEVKNLSINGNINPILGRGVVVHKNTDDLISQPTGGSGERIACGVIGAATR